MITTAFNMIYKTKPEVTCRFDSISAEGAMGSYQEHLVERHAQKVHAFFDGIKDFAMKNDYEGMWNLVQTVGKIHIKFGSRFDPEYWLVYKRTLLEQICMDSSPDMKVLWNRFLTLMFREMRKPYHEEILKSYGEIGFGVRRVTM